MIDYGKLLRLVAQRLNNPVNMKLDVRAEVKEIPDSQYGHLTTLVVYNTSEQSMKDGSAAIDNRIIDEVDLADLEEGD